MVEDSETLWCETCVEERPSGASFCQECGTKLTVRTPEPEEPALPAKEVVAPAPRKRLSKSQLVITGSLVAALVVAGGTYGVISAIQQEREATLAAEAAAEAAAEKARLEAETLIAAFGQDDVESFLPTCEQVAGLTSAEEGKWEAAVAAFDGISDPREASRVLDTVRSANGTLEDADVQVYLDGFEEGIAESLGALFASSSRDEQAPESQIDKWEGQWFSLSRDACPEEFDAFDSTYESLSASAARFSRMSTLASQVPWYPEGFDSYSSTIAYKWTTREGSWPCTGCSFWKMTIIAKNGCPNSVYAELNILRGGAVVDWTNDSLPSIRAGEPAILTFIDYPYNSSNSGRLVELNCR